MGTVIENSGTGTFGDVAQWRVNETVTPFVPGDTGVALGDGSLTVIRTASTELAVDNDLSVVHPVLGRANLKVNAVDLPTPRTAILTADSIMARFLSGAIRIPGVESGTPYGALDLACQLAGLKRSLDTNPRSQYWSLAGHGTGFDWQGKRVTPKGYDRTMTKKNLNFGTGVEVVEYEEITGLVTPAAFANASGIPYPCILTGPTPRIRNARTYVKFTTLTNLNSINFSFKTGPDFRQFASTMLDNTYTATVTYARMSKTLTCTISGLNSAGSTVTVTATATGTSLATGVHTVHIETYLNASNQLILRAVVLDSANLAMTPVTVSSAAATSDVAPSYAGQFTLTTGSIGVKDLIIREAALGDDQWANFCTATYVSTTPLFNNEISAARLGPPLAAANCELWDYLKQVASGRNVEIAPTPNGITLRNIGIRTLSLTNNQTVTRRVSTAAVGRNVAIINKNTTATHLPVTVLDSVQNYSVDVGQTIVVDMTSVDPGTSFVYSPKATANLTLVSMITGLPYFSYPVGATLPDLTRGYYYISGKDGLPVSPTQWLAYGGSVTAAINADGLAQLTFVGPRRAIPGVVGPFTLGLSDGATTRAKLILAGTGVQSNPATILLPTGADPAKTNVELATTIDNVGICDLAAVYERGAWSVQRASGPVTTLTAQVPVLTLAQFGIGAGSIVTYGYAKYRVDSVGIPSSGAASITASRLTTIADFQALATAETAGQYAARWTGMSALDQAIRPLLPIGGS